MKKWVAMTLGIMLVLTVTAAAAAVPSISTNKTTSIVSISTGMAEDDPFRIYEVEAPEAIQGEIKRLYDFVNAADETQPPSQFFSEALQQMLQESLPADLPLDSMLVNEIITIDEVNYDQKYGDVNVEFKFATSYEEGKTVTILLGLTYADVREEWEESEDREEYTEWLTIEAIALENGDLMVMFPQEVLLKMEQETAITAITMVIFNEP